MNVAETVKNILSTVFSQKAQAYVGIDIGSSYIKAVQLKLESGRIILETYGEVALGPYEEGGVAGQIANLEEEQLIEATKNLLSQANVTAKDALISIASSTSLIFILTLPRISEQEISSAVQSEVRKYIPIPLTEISLDWWIIPEEEVFGDVYMKEKKRGDIRVLVAAVRNEIIEKYEGIAKELGFRSHAYEIETFSMIRASLKHELAPVMLIDLGASGTRVSVVEHGVLRKFYSVNRGGTYLTNSIRKSLQIEFEDAERRKREVGLNREHRDQEVYGIIATGMEYIFSEVKKVLFDYEKEYRKPVSKIVLAGGGSLLHGLDREIENRYNIPTVYANPFKRVVSPDFLEEVLEKAGPEFSVALGLALQHLE